MFRVISILNYQYRHKCRSLNVLLMALGPSIIIWKYLEWVSKSHSKFPNSILENNCSYLSSNCWQVMALLHWIFTPFYGFGPSSGVWSISCLVDLKGQGAWKPRILQPCDFKNQHEREGVSAIWRMSLNIWNLCVLGHVKITTQY